MDEDTPPFRYDARLANEIELRWQDRWDSDGTFRTPSLPASSGRPKFYLLDFFPYPSGIGLHVGHPLGYIGTDVFGRYLRMTGHHVLHPFGFDTFGLPAEQYAIDTGQHPAVTVQHNAAVMRRQLRRLGLAHDRGREILTSDPSYYRWTQWIFLQIFGSWYDPARDRARPVSELIAEFASGRRTVPGGRPWASLPAAEQRDVIDGHRLAYLAEEVVNWCPGLGTVLADEEVTDEGRSAVGNYPVYRRPLRQWMLRITAYAERLLADLDGLDWPENVKRLQRNWIGPGGGPYHLRDWLFSRQRYWGEPFPIVYDEADPVRPDRAARAPAARHAAGDDRFPAGAAGRRQRPGALAGPGRRRRLGRGHAGPGGRPATLPARAERHAAVGGFLLVLPALPGPGQRHRAGEPGRRALLDVARTASTCTSAASSRPCCTCCTPGSGTRCCMTIGVTSTPEPFGRLFNQGYILADAFTDARGQYVPAAEVTRGPDGWAYRGQPVTRRAGKMGKSLKNGVSPDDMYDAYGADTLRLYEMVMGPLDGDRSWQTDGIIGMHRFLQRLWRLIVDEAHRRDPDPATAAAGRGHRPAAAPHDRDRPGGLRRAALQHGHRPDHRADRHAARLDRVPRALAEPLVLMVAPLAPHLAEELWQRLGHRSSLAFEPFPQADPALAADASVTLPVQVNGKVRFTIEVPAAAGRPRSPTCWPRTPATRARTWPVWSSSRARSSASSCRFDRCEKPGAAYRVAARFFPYGE